MKTLNTNARRWILPLSAFAISAFVLLFCSKSSPLYPMNDWVDVHCFLTLGRGLLNGMIPYVDLYEQKGPVLYFIYAIVALFSQKSMLGQYLLEVITFGLFLYYSAKIAAIYLGQRSFYLYPIMGALAACIASSYSFCHGGSVEQMCLFMFTYGLYSVLKGIHEGKALSFRCALTNGIFAGMVFWIKYTMTGFYIGLAIFVLIWYLIYIHDTKKLLATISAFLLGVAAVSTVVLLFFLIAGGLKELFTCYFYNNIFLYTDEKDSSSLLSIYNKIRYSMFHNLVYPSLIGLGFGWLLFRGKERIMDALAFIITFICLGGFSLIGKAYAYYGLVLSIFAIFGLIAGAWLCRELKVSELIRKLSFGTKLIPALISVFLIVLCTMQGYKHSSNTYLMRYEREEMPQYQFAQIINQTEDPTILNFGFLDGGFYYAADVLPTCPFFCSFNVNAPGMWQTQYDYIRYAKVDYVITRDYPLEDYKIHTDRYELVSTATMTFEGYDFTYYLYRITGEAQ
jgi:hypothetical protein